MNGQEIESYLINSRTKEKWERIGLNRKAGVTVPLFSLYSEASTGIGELTDLVLLADWCIKTGISIIQLLPLNDVGEDFAPYNAVSSFAIDPMYLNLNKLKDISTTDYANKLNYLKIKNRPILRHVNYKIKNAKINFLWMLFKKNSFPESEQYMLFKENNVFWLNNYALFKVLMEKFKGALWNEWEENIKNFNSFALGEIAKINNERIEFHKWMQWLIYEQFKSVKNEISEKGILLMGDLPFLVSRESADVWSQQNYFHLHLSSGAPPDMYFAMGQKWGMPPYDWNAIANDSFIYIKEKLKYAENFYDLYRIDHFVGLFRVWVTPADNYTIAGSFMPKEEYLWEPHGRKIIEEMVNATTMLPCAEDLGTVPGCSYHVLYEYGIPGIDFQRFNKINFFFKHVNEYRINSAAVLSTHDSSFWANWWKHEAGTIDEKFYETVCENAGIPESIFNKAKNYLFDKNSSVHGRLNWNPEISSARIIAEVLRTNEENIGSLIYSYMESFAEKEKFIEFLQLEDAYKKITSELIRRVLESVSYSNSIFSIQMLQDYLCLDEQLCKKIGKYTYRINTPGSVKSSNWSQLQPVSLEEMQELEINSVIKEIITASNR